MQEKRSRWSSYSGTRWSKPSGFVRERKSSLFAHPLFFFGLFLALRYRAAWVFFIVGVIGQLSMVGYVCAYSYAFAYLHHSGAARSRAWRDYRDGHDWSMAGAGRGMETMVTSLRAGETNLQVRRVVISGYYGFRNSGDEAVLKSILFALEEEGAEQGVQIVPIVLSGDPAWTTEMYGVEVRAPDEAGRSAAALFAAATGLSAAAAACCRMRQARRRSRIIRAIMKLAQLLGKPTFIYAQGIGPVNRRWMDRLIRGVMRRSAYVSVRDEGSAELLGQIGLPLDRIDVVPDPVMALPLPAAQPLGRAARRARPGAAAMPAAAPGRADAPGGAERLPLVGVSLRHWRKDGADLARVAAALGALARSRAVRLRFLPFHTPSDAEASRWVIGAARRSRRKPRRDRRARRRPPANAAGGQPVRRAASACACTRSSTRPTRPYRCSACPTIRRSISS